MLKLSFLELIFRAIPEGAIIFWACYILSKTKFQLNKYLLATSLYVLIAYIVRSLPIILGINTVLLLGVMIIINVNINKISIIKSINTSVCIIILGSICEVINMLMIKYLFKANLTYVSSNPLLKIIYGIPSLVLLVLLIIIINAILNKNKFKKEEIA